MNKQQPKKTYKKRRNLRTTIKTNRLRKFNKSVKIQNQLVGGRYFESLKDYGKNNYNIYIIY